MQNIGNGLYVSGKLSNEDYMGFIKHEVKRVTRLLYLSYSAFEREDDGSTSDEVLLMGVAAQLLEDLQNKIERQQRL